MRDSWPRYIVLAAAVSSLGACKSGDSSIGAPAMIGGQLVTFDDILVTFTPPSRADAIEAEGRLDAGAWESLGSGPGDSNQLSLTLEASAPEDADYSFRVRATLGTATSEWSQVATVHRGVRPATNLQLFAQYDQPIQLTWNRGSTQAGALLLDRRWVAFDGVAGAWSQLASLALDATSYLDADSGQWLDGSSFDYRVVYVKGTAESEPAMASSPQARPLAPVGLACSPAGETSIRLAWTPRSRYATKQVVVRSPRWGPGSEEVATLPGDAASYVDTVPAPGEYVYFVSARVGDWVNVVNYVADGAPTGGMTAIPGLPLPTSWLSFPGGDQAARRPDGRFATVAAVQGYPTNAVRTWQQVAGGWDSRDTTLDGYPQLPEPAIFSGPGDRLDILYGQVLGGTWHARFDGAWITESLAAPFPQDAALDALGALHLIACQAGYADYSTNANGAWVTERLPASVFADRCAIAVGPDGLPRVAYTSPQPVPPGQGGSSTASDLYLLSTTGSAWAEELAPLGAGATQRYGTLLRALAPSADRTVIVFAGPAPMTGDVAVGAIERDASGWGTPVAVGLRRSNGAPERFAVAASPDGSRVAIAWNGTTYQGSGSPATLAIRSAPGTWTSSSLLETGLGMAIGFSPAGKLWVLDGLGGTLGGVLYEEP